MEPNTLLHDFDCLPFFLNVIQSKLNEANQHLKKLELYKSFPEHFQVYTLNDIIDVHEEQSDFINVVYKQCHEWRKYTDKKGLLDQVDMLEKLTKKLETTVYHILYLAEQIKIMNGLNVDNENEAINKTDYH